ncbi:MAG: radical SAM protein [bacterium]
MAIGLTDRCNLRCGHCLLPSERAPVEMTLAELERLLDELVQASVLTLVLTGGEVGLRADLEEIVRAALARRFFVRVKTSATLLPPGRVRALSQAGLYHIETSIYSAQPTDHDRFVGKEGAWSATVESMRLFKELGGFVRVSTVAMSWNRDQISAVVELCDRLGFEHSMSPAVVCQSDGGQGPCALRMDGAELREILRNDRYRDAVDPSRVGPNSADRLLCGAGSRSPFIGPDGGVYLCQRLPWLLGNVREVGFREIWRSSEVRRNFVETKWGDLKECSSCTIASLCQRCPASALLEEGDLLGVPSVECAVARAYASAIGVDPAGSGGRDDE